MRAKISIKMNIYHYIKIYNIFLPSLISILILADSELLFEDDYLVIDYDLVIIVSKTEMCGHKQTNDRQNITVFLKISKYTLLCVLVTC